jgi:GNAT superfamily N-acetyltransferase
MYSVAIEKESASAVAEELASRLKRFNELRAGLLNTQPLVLSVRDSVGNVMAGLTGELFWNALYVEVLWVDEQYRGEGYGAALLEHAEKVACEHFCEAVYLSTFGFQAPSFYIRQGYKVIGELWNVPKGSSRQWFCKSLHKQYGV